ncbi:hypothetical protein RchiOBHm_Chr6g0280751 [Rosa chinensis]|uniref:Uncharacterized protein n=1 Tax=Rosa chinensis TaxID=74649 RepID=A0A2P6PTC5_ROSCH|nr:hypothetical protein RchiOBHm_Chr6g0280751 [Rosa chinensis]
MPSTIASSLSKSSKFFWQQQSIITFMRLLLSTRHTLFRIKEYARLLMVENC